MSQPKSLTWNGKQIQMYQLLKEGKSIPDVALAVGVSKSTVTKVANAIKKGQSPDDIKAKPTQVVPESDQSVDDKKKGTGVDLNKTPSIANVPGNDISQLLLRPVPQACPITPIMINARFTAVTEFGFPADIKWEDFFDTCLVHLFRYWGYGLQGVYKLSDQEKGNPPKPASGDGGGGNGHKQQSNIDEQAKKLGMLMIDILGAVNSPDSPQPIGAKK